MNKIREELIGLGYYEFTVDSCIHDVNCRLSWDINSGCFVYSRHANKLFWGKITAVFTTQSNEQWFTVKYNDNKRSKKVQRFCIDIKPVSNIPYNAKEKQIIQYIANKLKSNQFHLCQMFEKIVADSDQFNHIDVNLFNQAAGICVKSSTNDKIILKCTHLRRIFIGLKYYVLFKKNKLDFVTKQRFIKFSMDEYTNLIDDYIHFIDQHSDNSSRIKQELIKFQLCPPCNLKHCNETMRHYRMGSRNVTEHKINNESELAIYESIYDSLHFNIFHLKELGLRYNNEHETETDINFDCIDNNFAKRRDLIFKIREQYAFVSQRLCNGNNKFNIQIQENNADYDHSEDTVLDGMYKYIQKFNKVNINYLHDLDNFLKQQEYDTDAVYDDIELIAEKSNILFMAKLNSTLKNLISNYILKCKLSTASFSIGFTFFYWEWYRNKTDIAQASVNLNDFNGYSINELFIEPYYDSLKKEIIQSNFVTIQKWSESVVQKADKFFDSEKAKNTKYKSYGDTFHAGIAHNASISLQHIYSIILYCDMTKLCTHFSATFRKLHISEPLQSVKDRHSKYYFFAKLLRETCHYFGDYGIGAPRYGESGPFYCGISVVLNIPSFAIRLNSPTSTSKHIQIALNFAKRDGMVMEFQNDEYWNGIQQRFFNCQWISNYVEEAERIFIGGEWRMRLNSIRIIKTHQNFEKWFRTFYLFDCMVSGSDIDDSVVKLGLVEMEALEKVIGEILSPSETTELDKYIIDTFRVFANSKIFLKFNLEGLCEYFATSNQLIMNKIVEYDTLTERETDEKDETVNLFKPEIFSIFRNVDRIQISGTDLCGEHSYKFSMLSLLHIIDNELLQSVNSIKVSAKRLVKRGEYEWDKEVLHSWLFYSFSKKIKKAFKKKGWFAHFQEGNGQIDNLDCLIILREHLGPIVLINEFGDKSRIIEQTKSESDHDSNASSQHIEK